MVDVLTQTEIARPRSEVADFAASPDRATDWYANIESVEWLTPPPLAVGTRLSFVASFLGRRLAYTYVVVDLARGTRMVMRTDEGPFPMKTTYAWEDVANGTRMTLRNEGEPRGFSKVAAPVMMAAMRRANTKDLARLKEILESRTPGTGP